MTKNLPRPRSWRARLALLAIPVLAGPAALAVHKATGSAASGNATLPCVAGLCTQGPPPISAVTAASLQITVSPPTTTPAVSSDAALQAVLLDWPNCSLSSGKSVTFNHVIWAGPEPPFNDDMYLVPLTCPYGNDSSLAHGSGATTPQANTRIEFVSSTGTLLGTISGFSQSP